MIPVNGARHGYVCRRPDDFFGYYAWPSVARLDDGTLVVASSGLRMAHVCPFGKTTIFFSRDEGETWSPPAVVNDSPLDDRDAGVLALGGQKLLLSWFNLETKYYAKFREGLKDSLSPQRFALSEAMAAGYTPELDARYAGSFVRLSRDGGNTWEEPVRVPVTAPHGPSLLSDGTLLVMGKGFIDKEFDDVISVYAADGEGKRWSYVGAPPLPEDAHLSNFFEPHLLELPSGRLIAQIRFQHSRVSKTYLPFTIFQTESDDRGKTWSVPRCLGVCGSPPHLIRHSSGALVSVYGRRAEPFGICAMISWDEGRNWAMDYALTLDAHTSDLGYPASVELPDGSLLTVYYIKPSPSEPCGIGYSRWTLPKAL